MPSRPDPSPGQAVYTRRTLRLYDFVVLCISNRWIWKCPTPKLLEFYNRHLSVNHLDVGVGTGYFLDHCSFSGANPRLALMDLNPECLAATAHRIARYRPEIHQANVLEPIRIDAQPFDSIGLNYLLHCLPGTMSEKATALDHLNEYLKPDGTVFGSTLLHKGVESNWLASQLTSFYNRKGIFGNSGDSLEALGTALDTRYCTWQIEVVGCAALFNASGKK